MEPDYIGIIVDSRKALSLCKFQYNKLFSNAKIIEYYVNKYEEIVPKLNFNDDDIILLTKASYIPCNRDISKLFDPGALSVAVLSDKEWYGMGTQAQWNFNYKYILSNTKSISTRCFRVPLLTNTGNNTIIATNMISLRYNTCKSIKAKDIPELIALLSNNIKIACFISIPKCGTNTIISILEMPSYDIDRHNESVRRLIIDDNHKTLDYINQKYNLHNVFIFTFVRHPYQRIASWFFFHKKLQINHYLYLTFEQWLRNGMPHHHEGDAMIQCDYIDSKHKTVDFVGKIENFEDDMKKLIGILNDRCIKLNVRHKFSYSPIKENENIYDYSYTQEMKDLVYERCKRDFIAFGYER